MTKQKRKNLVNPPIKEAIFAIYFNEIISAEKLNNFKETDYVKSKYPVVKLNYKYQVTNKSSENTGTDKLEFHTNHQQEGYTLQCENDCNNLIQVFPTHLSYHNFNKYAGWSSMYSELEQIWKLFSGSVGSNNISRLNVRYINQIELPLPLTNGFGDYITLLPVIPSNLNQSVNNFFMQVNIPDALNQMHGTITETILPNTQNKNSLNFLIDLSVLKQGPFDCNDSEIWNWLTKMREFKNELFFSCITEKTENLFN